MPNRRLSLIDHATWSRSYRKTLKPQNTQSRDLRTSEAVESIAAQQVRRISTRSHISYPGLPLEHADSIRLVHLNPTGNESDAADISFINVRLSDAPVYSALSYTWDQLSGPPVQGLRYTPNLAAAMSYLSSLTSKMELWWVDALCIDQDNVKEKADQVAMMRSIYETASKVWVWLGRSDLDSQPAFDLIKQIHTLKVKGRLTIDGEAIEKPFDSDTLGELDLPPAEHPAWMSLMKTLQRPYFQRMWVLQELAAAVEDPYVALGPLQMSWDLFIQAVQLFRDLGWQLSLEKRLFRAEPHSSFSRGSDAMSVLPIIQSFQLIKEPAHVKVYFYLVLLSWFQTSDARDKINALYGLISVEDQRDGLIVPNYKDSTSQVFRDVTAKLIIRSKSFQILASVNNPTRRHMVDLPSWVPDYSSILRDDRGESKYEAAGKTSFFADWTPGTNTLRVRAVLVDEVSHVSDFPLNKPGHTYREVLSAWFKKAAEICLLDEKTWLMNLYQHTEDDREVREWEQFWRTVLGDEVDGEHPAPERYEFCVWCAIMRQFLDHIEDEEEKQDILAMASEDEYGETVCLKDVDYVAPEGIEIDNLMWAAFENSIRRNKFLYTKSGRMGLGPESVQPGDRVAIFSSEKVIDFLREKPGHFEFLGDGYVHGVMNGEGVPEDGQFSEVELG